MQRCYHLHVSFTAFCSSKLFFSQNLAATSSVWVHVCEGFRVAVRIVVKECRHNSLTFCKLKQDIFLFFHGTCKIGMQTKPSTFLLKTDIFPVLHAASFPFNLFILHHAFPLLPACHSCVLAVFSVLVSLGVGPFLTLPVSMTSSKK